MILVITVNYNNALLTNKLLESIDSAMDSDKVKVIIIDNDSKDKNQIVNKNFSNILYLDANIGYFPAINIALKTVDLKLYEYVIICNNDIEFNHSFFTNLLGTYYSEDIYVICPRIIDLDGNDQNPVLEGRISRIKVFFYDLYFINYLLGSFMINIWSQIKSIYKSIHKSKLALGITNNKKITMGYGAIYILTKNFFLKNALLDSPSFLMGEEAFLAYQVLQSGGYEFFDPVLIVNHNDHSTCNKIPRKDMYNITKQSYKIYRNKMLSLPTV